MLERLTETLNQSAEELLVRFVDDFPSYFQVERSNQQLLAQLKNRGIRIALLTNGGPMQRPKLAAAGLTHYFEDACILISKETGFAKPTFEAFSKLSDVIGLSAENILFVGDHIGNDIAGAHAAGLQTAWVSQGAELTGAIEPDLIIRNSLFEIIDYL
ncbi:hypothetical protein GCM10007047_20500 [Cerasicoccus arenae]|uniref:HAD family hydrolase n=2 Tax=Cerasicoccus arenae TaxID=424488 RepID=A0A8J3DI83_9BACT|nr:hypothetical protein GCM10007047_20500 [Cerasicoccus arenae]